MKIAVLVKEVPDTYTDRTLDRETGLADRAASDAVLDEIGERALEVALAAADADPGIEVVLVSMGPGSAEPNLRKALAMGASSALHVVDDGLRGADYSLTAEVLAAAARRVGADLVVAGNLSTDGTGGVIAAMVAEHLGAAELSSLAQVTITRDGVSGIRAVDSGFERVSAPLPAVVSITESLPDARFPNFKGIMAAKKKPIETITATALGVDLTDETAGRSIVVAITERPARAAGTKIVDEGDAASQLADFLIANRLA